MTGLPLRQVDGVATLDLLDELDAPWIAALIDEVEAAVGQPWRELLERLARLPVRARAARRAAAIAALRGLLSGRARGGLRARQIRERLLGRPALDGEARTRRLADVAAALSTTGEALEQAMWADLPGERAVHLPAGRPTALAVAGAANLALIQRALARCHDLRLVLTGNARAVVRAAAARGLMTTARPCRPVTTPRPRSAMEAGPVPGPMTTAPPRGPMKAAPLRGASIELAISGPLALFHRTTIYGRALGSLVPHLAWCEHFVLDARCDFGRGPVRLQLRPPLVLPPGPAPRRYDSALEARFARDLARRAPRWRVQREPSPIDAGGKLAFPDFLLEHRDDDRRRWWLEIVGFWTSDYLQHKLATYRAARLPRVILCIDAAHTVAPHDLPRDARIIRYTRAISVDDVLAILEAAP